MKRILVMLSIGILMLAACGNDKYVDKIDKAVKMQDQKQEQMAKMIQAIWLNTLIKDANIYVYENGKYVVLAYKPLSNNEEVHYYTYQFDGKKRNALITLTQNNISNHMMLIIRKKI